MTLELGGCIFFEFPVRHTAGGTGTLEPFVSKPSCGTAVSGIVDHERFVAMGRDPGLVAHYINGLDSVKEAAPGWPELDLLDQSEKFHPFAVKSFGCFL